MRNRLRRALLAATVMVGTGAPLVAQTPAPRRTDAVEQVTFRQAIDRAIQNNPTVAAASASILRAEGLLRQARAATLLQVNAPIVFSTLNRTVEFSGQTVVPSNQITAALAFDMPIVAAAAWARRAQAEDQTRVAELSVADVRRQVAVSAADAYLTIIATRRTVEADHRARDVAKAHFDLASELEQRGSGSHLNTLRAQQQYSTDLALVESASLALYRAQEALGTLIVAGGPVDAVEEPAFDIPADGAAADLLQSRTDLKLFAFETQAAERVVRDSRKDWWPSLDALFQPQTLYPGNLFSYSTTWTLFFRGSVPIFDSGSRTGVQMTRQAALNEARATLTGARTQADAAVQSAREAVAAGERSLARTREAADQAQQVVDITNVAFRAGAATNIEVIDAERSARDADTAVAVAEDTLRRARFELLNALGRFP